MVRHEKKNTNKKSCRKQKSKGMPESVYASDGGEYAIAMVVSL